MTSSRLAGRLLGLMTCVALSGACVTSRAAEPAANRRTSAAGTSTITSPAAATHPAASHPAIAYPAVASAASGSRGPTKLLVVMFENESRTHALAGMPKLAALAKSYGLATNYGALAHPSLPNYLAIAGGSTFGVADDAAPGAHPVHGSSIFGQALRAGKTAKTYAESMPRNCFLEAAGTYGVKHNPWAYFSDAAERAACDKLDVPSGTTSGGALRNDVGRGALPTIGMLIPNICNDAHDCPLSVADNWLANWLTTIRRGPDWTSGRLAIVITFDEDDYSQANHVLTVVVAPGVRGEVARRPLNHYSLTRYADELTGAAPMGGARHATSLRTAFTGLGGA